MPHRLAGGAQPSDPSDDDGHRFGASGLVVEHGPASAPDEADERHVPSASDDADGPEGRSYAERTVIHSLNSRLAMIPVAILASLTIAACGGNDAQEASKKIQQQGTELQQQGQQLQEDAQQAAKDVQNGTRSAEDVQKELEQKTKAIEDKAKDTTNDAIDAVKDADNLPDSAKKALEDAQQQVNATP